MVEHWTRLLRLGATRSGRLKTLPSHDVLVLLRSSFSARRLMHTLRCAPRHRHSVLQNCGDLLRDGVSAITNSSLKDTLDPGQLIHWRWGLGIRQGTLFAISAFLASAACTSDLQNALLATCGDVPDTHVAFAQLVWTSINDGTCPQDENDEVQRT